MENNQFQATYDLLELCSVFMGGTSLKNGLSDLVLAFNGLAAAELFVQDDGSTKQFELQPSHTSQTFLLNFEGVCPKWTFLLVGIN